MNALLAYRPFTGNAAELAQAAVQCAASMGLDVDADKTNERLIRYYQGEGVIDRPDRTGRDSVYHYRQLVQLLSARRIVMAGLPLSLAIEKNLTSNTDALEADLLAPLPNPAELLVSRFKSGGEAAPSFSVRAKSSAPRQPVAVVDVLAEVQSLRREMKQLREELDYQQSRTEKERHEMRDMVNSLYSVSLQLEGMLSRLVDQQLVRANANDAVLEPFKSLLAEVAARQEELLQSLGDLYKKIGSSDWKP